MSTNQTEVVNSDEDRGEKRKLVEEQSEGNDQEGEDCKRGKTDSTESETGEGPKEKEIPVVGSDTAASFFAPSRLKPRAIPVMQFTNLSSGASSSFGGSAWNEALNIKQPFSFMGRLSDKTKESDNQENDNLATKDGNLTLNGDDGTKENIFQKFLKKHESQKADSTNNKNEEGSSVSEEDKAKEGVEKAPELSQVVQESKNDDSENSESRSSSFEKSQPIGTTKLEIKYEEVPVVTGEEHETQLIEMPCQLYKFVPSTKVWQECGRGILHLNDSKSSDDEIIHSRIVIRANATHRVILNTKVWPEMKAEKANSTSLRVTACDMNSEVCIYLIQSRNSDLIKQLQRAIAIRTKVL